MTKAEQKRFVRDLSKSIADSIIKVIDEGKVPAEWNGHELRALLIEKYDGERAISPVLLNKRGKRYREFRNTVIVNNL